MARRRVIALLMASSFASAATAASQQELNALADKIGVRVAILDNKPPKCPGQSSGCVLSEIDLTMPPTLTADLAGGGFKVFFSSVNPVIQADSDLFGVRFVNGDLHVLELRPGVRLSGGATYRIKLWSQGHYFSEYYIIPNMFLVSGTHSATIAATRPSIDPDSGLEVLPFVAPMADEAKLGIATPDDKTLWETPERAFDRFASRSGSAPADDIAIIPTPAAVRHLPGRPIDLSHGVRLTVNGLAKAQLQTGLADLASVGIRSRAIGPRLSIRISRTADLKPEGYRLTARNGGIAITASDAAGARYALESLAQEGAHESRRLRPIEIEDAPRFSFRGLHLDLARNFHSKAEVLKIIEQMGRYKLNKLHLHLGDDEGWRLQIAHFPELTKIGGYRCYDPTESRCLQPQLGSGPDRNAPVNGYLSGEEYIQILKAAKARGIEVIPSFDMPGHSRAAIHSMEARYRRLMAAGRRQEAERYRLVEPDDTTQYRSVQYYSDNTLNVCLDSTYRFIDAVIDDIAALHAAAGAPLKTYHIGADETAGAWSGSPACKALMARTGLTVVQLGPMFIQRVAASLARRGITGAGWSDGLDHVDRAEMPRNVQSDIWGDLFTAAPAEANRAVNLGWRTVIAVPNVLYFDMPYAPNPLERGYDWGTRGVDTFWVFEFMPENLGANASVMTDIHNKPVTVTDTVAMDPQRSFAGQQANLWSETLRRDSSVDYMLFPRLLALSERSWHRASWEPYAAGGSWTFGDGKVDLRAIERDWAGFAAKMPQQLRSLERAGIMYRLAPPGARIVDGKLEANSEFPGQTIEYRVEGAAWTRYARPIPVNGAIQLRSRSFDGRRTSRIVEISAR